MIRFPNIKALSIGDQEKQILYNSVYDIFVLYKIDVKWRISDESSINQTTTNIEYIKDTTDILKYKNDTRTKEQKQADIIEQFKADTIFEFAGFEMISQSNPIFVNQFLQNQTLKENIINMIKQCKQIEDKQSYIDSVVNIPDSNQDLLRNFKTHLQEKIRKEQFDSITENMVRLVSSIVCKFCDGKTELGDTHIKLPPLQGVEEDILELYNSPKIQTDLLTSVTGSNLMKYSTDPVVLCFIKICSRVYNNYGIIREEERRKQYIKEKQKQIKKQKNLY